MKVNLSPRLMYQSFLHLALAVLAAEVIVLSTQNDKISTALMRMSIKPLSQGDSLQFGVVLPLDSSDSVSDSVRQLIFTFTTSCPYCEKIIPHWRDFAKTASKNGIRVLALCLDGPQKKLELMDYVRKHHIDYPIYIVRDPVEFRKQVRIQGVPQTILRSSVGLVEKVWSGALTDEGISEVSAALSN